MHLTSVTTLSRSDLDDLFDLCDRIRQSDGLETFGQSLNGKIGATMFFQASTRTSLSFKTAIMRLGGEVLPFSPEETRAGNNWGEELRDTARMLNSYADVVIFRHAKASALQEYLDSSTVPVINGGNGSGIGAEHPTQAILDLYTMWSLLKRIDGLRILMIGDPKIRGARSLSMALAKFRNVKLYALSPDGERLDQEMLDWQTATGVEIEMIDTLDDVLDEIDVLYHHGISELRNREIPELIKLKKSKLTRLCKDALILHALPRAEELDFDVDTMPQAKYFEQAENGVYTRMAILLKIFGVKERQ